ncbi:unnamed protein product [Prorocentrum cordatum]|uniref:Uncharacterized protein n=1 Tax=Prorocentrum cordatum TaxID=2364126 RepID=A0ABN9RL41_9DINO|nr:unnamed protein product [Polarella glacialis]
MFDSCIVDTAGRAADDVDQVERRAARNLEVSSAAISAHIAALSERLLRLETHRPRLSCPLAGCPPRLCRLPQRGATARSWRTSAWRPWERGWTLTACSKATPSSSPPPRKI